MANLAGNELAQKVTRHLGGEWHGSYGVAPGPGHGKHDRSLTIRVHRSNPKDVVLHSFADDDWQAIKDDLRRDGILPEWGGKSSAPAESKKERAEQEAKQKAEDKANEARRRWHANQLWKLRQPIHGTLAEAYLREARSVGSLPLPPLDMLGFLPAGLADRKIPYPAMIAAHGMPEEYEPGRLKIDEVSGVRLTFLQGPNKAPMDDPRKAHGLCKGHPIVVAPPNDGLALCIAEGIETVLSVHLARGIGAWATGSANFMPGLADVMPSYIESVTIWAEKGKAGQDGARELQERLTARGFEVRLAGYVSWLR